MTTTIAEVFFAAQDAEEQFHRDARARGAVSFWDWYRVYTWEADTDRDGRTIHRAFSFATDGYLISRPAGCFNAESLSREPFRMVWATDDKSLLAAGDVWVIITYCEGDLTILWCTDQDDFNAAYNAAAAYYKRGY